MKIIDLKKKVTKKFLDSKHIVFPENLPFSSFQIAIPYSVFADKKRMRKIVKETFPHFDFFELNRFVEDIFGKKYCLHIKQKKYLNFILYDPFEKKDFKFLFDRKTKEIGLLENNIIVETEQKLKEFTFHLIKISAYTIDYLNNPPTSLEPAEGKKVFQDRDFIKNNNKKNNSVIYINKKKYQRKEKSENKKEYSRHKENWEVRGHYRRYRDEKGNVIKKVWIKPHTRGPGKKEKEKKDNKIYKIE